MGSNAAEDTQPQAPASSPGRAAPGRLARVALGPGRGLLVSPVEALHPQARQPRVTPSSKACHEA